MSLCKEQKKESQEKAFYQASAEQEAEDDDGGGNKFLLGIMYHILYKYGLYAYSKRHYC